MGAVVIISIMAVLAVAGAAIGHRKGRTLVGLLLGLLLGLIGLLILAFIPKTREAQIRQAQNRFMVDAAARARQQDIDAAATGLRKQP